MSEDETFATLVRPLQRTTWRFYSLLLVLAAVTALGLIAYGVQLRDGLGVTGMNDAVSWGLYISTFIVFIAISMAGTLVSAVLRLTGAEWRRPITRIAEVVTVTALIVAGLLPIVDMGHPERLLNILLHGRLESALVWDILSLSTYLAGSALYLYLPLIPDMAMLRDAGVGGPVRRRLYRVFALGWRGTPGQKHHLDKGMRVLAVLMIPVAVSIHTVTAWIFAVTPRVGWHTAFFGPFFVVGALLSGLATLLIVMAVFRKVYGLETFLTPEHFRRVAVLMLVLDFVVMYFTLNEVLTANYGADIADQAWMTGLAQGAYAPLFWGMLVGGFLVPALLLIVTRARSVATIVVAAILVNVGMWIERMLIVVPSMAAPQMPVEWTAYQPTWVEWSIVAGAFGGFALMVALLSRVFPIVSPWELEEGEQHRAGRDPPVARPVAWPAARHAGKVVAVGLLLALVLAVGAVRGEGDPGPGAAADAIPSVVLSLEVPADARAGENTTLWAAVNDTATGDAIPDKEVSFSLQSTFGWLSLGTNVTDEDGRTSIVFRPGGAGVFTVAAAFAGDDTYAADMVTASLSVGGGAHHGGPDPDRGLIVSGTVMVTVVAVWSVYALVGWHIVAIRLDGRRRRGKAAGTPDPVPRERPTKARREATVAARRTPPPLHGRPNVVSAVRSKVMVIASGPSREPARGSGANGGSREKPLQPTAGGLRSDGRD